MNADGVLRRVVAALSSADVACMLTGSVAAAYHGAPRATLDIDLVIVASGDQVRRVVAACLEAGFYASEQAALEALASGGMFNVIDAPSGWKVDLIHRKERPFSRQEFERREPAELSGVRLDVATLEDVILSKLEWARLGGSRRQLEDVNTLVRVRQGELDRTYLDRWVEELNVTDEWAQVLRELDREAS